jgi:glycosyltransferase involved in cell wall biosynthesis
LIAIIVPAHDAQDHIDACLESLVRAARHPALAHDDVQITVVLDRCSDRTGWLARSWGAHTMDVQAGHTAAARKAGADAAVRAGARWIAFADADSVVAEDWLAAQVAQSSDVVCNAVVDGALDTSHPMFEAANFGLSAKAYQAAGERQLAREREAVPRDVGTSPQVLLLLPRPVAGGSGAKPPKPLLQARWAKTPVA